MKGRHQLSSLACSHHAPIYLCQHLHPIAHLIYIGGSDKGHGHAVVNAPEWCLGAETAQLPSIGITAGINIHRAQMLAVEQYQSGARTESGQPFLNGLTHGVKELQVVEQPHHRGTLTTRDNQPVFRLLPVALLPHLETLHAQPRQHLPVFNEGPLKGQYRYSHFPRSAIKSSISCSLIPTIASPRSSERLASKAASL